MCKCHNVPLPSITIKGENDELEKNKTKQKTMGA
jgi:hypothetical protein